MKKVLNVAIGGRSFVLEEDAYRRLELYLNNYRKKIDSGNLTKEVMDEVEERIAELLSEYVHSANEVVNLNMINTIASRLGMPDESQEEITSHPPKVAYQEKPRKRFFRDPDNRVFGGVCGGIAAYIDVDVLLVRVIFVASLFFAFLTIWAYIIFWIASPLAKTPVEKCEMRGLPLTIENLNKYTFN